MSAPLNLYADARFARCAAFVLQREGWGTYTDDPHDAGGPTRWGVTLAALEEHRGKPCTAADVEALSENEALAIYRGNYWDAVGADGLTAGPDLMSFDAAVNQGPGRAARFLQSAVGATIDGIVGAQTLAAANAWSADALVDRLKQTRMAAYWDAPGWNEYGRGWANRLTACAAQAHRWVGA